MRRCGSCTLCCRLLPQAELGKPGGQQCEHQRHTGCRIYPKRPYSCRAWSCRWLLEMDTGDLRRPDFSHYVVDLTPDYITRVDTVTGERVDMPVLQVWVDPRHPEAHRDPQLRAMLDRQEISALIRYSSNDGFVLFPPSVTGRGWIENHDGVSGDQHTAEQVLAVAPDLLIEAVTRSGAGA